MEILLDTANVKSIQEIISTFPIKGVTTNPSILAKGGTNVKDTLAQIHKTIGKERSLHIQTTATTADGMVKQAKQLSTKFGANFYIKIPVTRQGIKAIMLCKAEGIKVTATAIFTPMQALTAALAGADYVAPYVDRLDNITSDGVAVVSQIAELFSVHKLKTKILAASFKNVQQVLGVAMNGADAVTISEDLCEKLLFHPYTDKSINDFESDWNGKFGKAEITDFVE